MNFWIDSQTGSRLTDASGGQAFRAPFRCGTEPAIMALEDVDIEDAMNMGGIQLTPTLTALRLVRPKRRRTCRRPRRCGVGEATNGTTNDAANDRPNNTKSKGQNW